jgi:hypothetical protein
MSQFAESMDAKKFTLFENISSAGLTVTALSQAFLRI